MNSKCTLLIAASLFIQGVPAFAGPFDCKGKIVSSEYVYIYELKSQGEGDALKTNEVSLVGGQLCNVGGKIEVFNKSPVTSGHLAFFCGSENLSNADVFSIDLKEGKKLPPAWIGFALKRCKKNDEAKMVASWTPHRGADPRPAHEIAHEADGDITEEYIKNSTNLVISVPAREKADRYIAAYDKQQKQQAASGNGWMGFWNKCFMEQIAAVQDGRAINQSWFPKAGQTFSADDGLFTVTSVISQNPLRLLIEGPAQVDGTVANRCYAVLRLKDKSQLQVTQTPSPGYTIQVRDQIHGFTVKVLGKATVQIKTLRAVTAEEKVLPEFQLLGTIPMAQRP